MKYRELPGPPG